VAAVTGLTTAISFDDRQPDVEGEVLDLSWPPRSRLRTRAMPDYINLPDLTRGGQYEAFRDAPAGSGAQAESRISNRERPPFFEGCPADRGAGPPRDDTNALTGPQNRSASGSRWVTPLSNREVRGPGGLRGGALRQEESEAGSGIWWGFPDQLIVGGAEAGLPG